MKQTVSGIIFSLCCMSVVHAAPTNQILKHAFECQKPVFYPRFDAALQANKIPTSATRVTLVSPIDVFGVEVSDVSVDREGGEDKYVTYFPGKSVEEVARIANIKASKQGYAKVTKKNSVLSVETDGKTTFLQCAVNFE